MTGSDFNPAAQVVALITAYRSGLDQAALVVMIGESIEEGATCEAEVVNRLAQIIGLMTVVTGHACDEWDQADGSDISGRWLAVLGRLAVAS